MSENLKATLAIIAWSVIFPLIVIVLPQKWMSQRYDSI